MVCCSGSVERAAQKSKKAQEQVDELNKQLLSEMEQYKKEFYAAIDAHLKDANITDAREIGYNADIKTEYTSEFSLDKIADVVIKGLDALKKAKDPSVDQPATDPAAIDAYTNLVMSVAEAAKSSSKTAGSLSFSMNRLTPGIFVFLYSKSQKIYDEDTFGTEAVTSTAILYRIVESIEDVKRNADFIIARINAQSLIKMKTLQAALVEQLANGKIGIDDWNKKDKEYSAIVAKLQANLDASGFKKEHPLQPAAFLFSGPGLISPAATVAEKAAKSLQVYAAAAEKTTQRLAAGYFST